MQLKLCACHTCNIIFSNVHNRLLKLTAKSAIVGGFSVHSNHCKRTESLFNSVGILCKHAAWHSRALLTVRAHPQSQTVAKCDNLDNLSNHAYAGSAEMWNAHGCMHAIQTPWTNVHWVCNHECKHEPSLLIYIENNICMYCEESRVCAHQRCAHRAIHVQTSCVVHMHTDDSVRHAKMSLNFTTPKDGAMGALHACAMSGVQNTCEWVRAVQAHESTVDWVCKHTQLCL